MTGGAGTVPTRRRCSSHLEQHLEILTLFRRVRAQVLAATGGEQRPHPLKNGAFHGALDHCPTPSRPVVPP